MVKGKRQNNTIAFLKALIKFYPYRIHRILTDNGRKFGKQFSLMCKKLKIKHKRTKVKHPWTNGQVETTIKRIKNETIFKKYYPNYQALKKDLIYWQNKYNLETSLRSIGGLTPVEKVIEYYQSLDEEKRKNVLLKKPPKKSLKFIT